MSCDVTMLVAYNDNSDNLCGESESAVSIVVPQIVLHFGGTNHNYPEYGLIST